LVQARGLSFFFCCRTRSVVPVVVRHVAPVASLELWPQIPPCSLSLSFQLE
jgi:hypothetical protein